ncbi:hypothetical protein GCM10010472_07490 [Pseudonocardia halophobica]|uniref:histidine kinase n=1 Tax=Pseudonocardia halophobica TaxID=29401 RepID=A0A9W6L5Y0_9PSEU|nr:sensor histidine kinase [Pseudonocardia halophobica]GLL14236.1 hypothetical protein GCM10017577_53830 [Pseudonocardia halophobica]
MSDRTPLPAGAGFRSHRRVGIGTGRRARSSLLLSGLIGAAGVIAPGVVVGLLGGGPAWWVTGLIAGVVLAVGIALMFSATARRASTAVLVGASEFGGLSVAVCSGLLVVLLVFGRIPLGAERALLNPALVGMLVVAVVAGPLGRRAARTTRAALQGVRRSPDELLADFAERAGRGTPVDDLLRQLAETMRQDWRLSRVQIWADRGDAARNLARSLVVPQPVEPGPEPLPLDADELATLQRAGVAGPGWLELWLPHLVEEDGPARRGQLRLAPAVHGGEVLALVVIERDADADTFGEADERALAEVVRRLAIVLRNRALDEALQATLADLRRTNADLQASRTRLVAAADAERRRIERDLHDGAQQHLVALAVGLRLVRDTLTSPDDPNAELLDELDRGVRDSIQALRDLAHGIYPPLLRDAGLGDALRAAAKRSPLTVEVHADGVGRMPEQAEAAVYFCCLEALQNAGKHAPGAHVTITLKVEAGADGDELTVVVADDGPGFDPARVAGGGGLQNMADRLGAIGGTVELVSAPGEGTVLTGRIPVPAAGTNGAPAPRPPVSPVASRPAPVAG